MVFLRCKSLEITIYSLVKCELFVTPRCNRKETRTLQLIQCQQYVNLVQDEGQHEVISVFGYFSNAFQLSRIQIIVWFTQTQLLLHMSKLF